MPPMLSPMADCLTKDLNAVISVFPTISIVDRLTPVPLQLVSVKIYLEWHVMPLTNLENKDLWQSLATHP